MVVRELVVVLAAAAACVVELRPCRGVEGQDVTGSQSDDAPRGKPPAGSTGTRQTEPRILFPTVRRRGEGEWSGQ